MSWNLWFSWFRLEKFFVIIWSSCFYFQSRFSFNSLLFRFFIYLISCIIHSLYSWCKESKIMRLWMLMKWCFHAKLSATWTHMSFNMLSLSLMLFYSIVVTWVCWIQISLCVYSCICFNQCLQSFWCLFKDTVQSVQCWLVLTSIISTCFL